MDLKRLRDIDDDALIHRGAQRRQAMAHPGPGPVTSGPTSRDEYDIAWVCALYIEMAAAQAMLDEVHKGFHTHPSDSNSYVFGRIGKHNIVMACLPDTQYGTNNAAHVVTNLQRTFGSIRLCLMVGIGGGVPSKVDIRLGDIVVGSRVMQYDLAKIHEEGEIQRTAIPRLPERFIGTTVSNLRAKYELHQGRVPAILKGKIAEYSDYRFPKSADDLFQNTYKHPRGNPSCARCDRTKLQNRSSRGSTDPVIHYGAIASGNQVIKSARVRDDVSKELDVICFEMEAAGILGTVPSLTIRGICDYCDSHKSKEWQRYASATAAAYAREFLETLPPTEHSINVSVPTLSLERSEANVISPQLQRDRLLASFEFDQIDSRRTNIKSAQKETCKWFLSHSSYQDWLDPTKLQHHHGFLWLAGKPGAGKSTMIKYAHSKAQAAKGTYGIVASFFFNARGEAIERSVFGMYRALIFQLLKCCPDAQTVLDSPELSKDGQDILKSLDLLKSIFQKAVLSLGQQPFCCFIDALDECDEQQALDLLRYFEDLAKESTQRGIQFRICFSSRHYPYLDIQPRIRMILERQNGHREDLACFIRANLRVSDPSIKGELETMILDKAAGVFLWVALVTNILNQEDRNGRPTLKYTLNKIPPSLSALFRSIMNRDNERLEDLRLCIIWVLYAQRPLKPAEFYHALWAGLYSKDSADQGIPDIYLDSKHNRARIDRYVISSSKGLAEVTKSKPHIVQFIHESVRDFLIKDGGLQQLWPDLGYDLTSPCHKAAKDCCEAYLSHPAIQTMLNMSGPHKSQACGKFPFLKYASQNVLVHANLAGDSIGQSDFLSRYSDQEWIRMLNLPIIPKISHYLPNTSLLYVLAELGLSELIHSRLKSDTSINDVGGRYNYPIFAALMNGHKEAVAALLRVSSTLVDELHILECTDNESSFERFQGFSPLSWASFEGNVTLMKLLLTNGSNADEIDGGGDTPLLRAISGNREEAAMFLIERGVDINVRNKAESTPLLCALFNQEDDIARILLDKGASINVRDSKGKTPLLMDVEYNYGKLSRQLIALGAEINAADETGLTALLIALEFSRETIAKVLFPTQTSNENSQPMPCVDASSKGHEILVMFLIQNGADTNARTNDGETALMKASQSGFEAAARLFIQNGADVNSKTRDGSTALWLASKFGREPVVKLLVENGANVDTQALDGSSPLMKALEEGHEDIAIFLVQNGADVDAITADGLTPFDQALLRGNVTLAMFFWEHGALFDPRTGNTKLIHACKHGHETTANFLIELGADVNASSSGTTALFSACESGQEAIARLLLEHGARIDDVDKHNSTPLHYACKFGLGAVVKLLISRGAAVNARTRDGVTPLLNACEGNYEMIVRYLLEHGAHLDVRTNVGNAGFTPLHHSIKLSEDSIVRLLIAHGAEVDAVNSREETALHVACLNANEEKIRLLIDSGANTNAADENGNTPLLCLKYKGNGVALAYLIEHGADVNASNKEGVTPLIRSCKHGFVEWTKLLLHNSADSNVTDKTGNTPLVYTCMKNYQRTADLLLRHGAMVNVRSHDGHTPLSIALDNDFEGLERLLLEHGALQAG